MENKNKYYTPEIEEFHVGFEFESNYLKSADVWEKKILKQEDADYFFSQYIADATPTEFRVKHLDREDIESEGWVKNISIENYWKLNNFVLRLKDSTVSIYIYDEYWTDKVVFDGKVKNISELRKIMKMLGIKK